MFSLPRGTGVLYLRFSKECAKARSGSESYAWCQGDPCRQSASQDHSATDRPWLRLAICGHRHALSVWMAQRRGISTHNVQVWCRVISLKSYATPWGQYNHSLPFSDEATKEQRSWPTFTQTEGSRAAESQLSPWPRQSQCHSLSHSVQSVADPRVQKTNSKHTFKARATLQLLLFLGICKPFS